MFITVSGSSWWSMYGVMRVCIVVELSWCVVFVLTCRAGGVILCVWWHIKEWGLSLSGGTERRSVIGHVIAFMVLYCISNGVIFALVGCLSVIVQVMLRSY